MKIKYLWGITPTFLVSLGLFFDVITIEYFSSSIYTLLQYVCLIPIILYCVCNLKEIHKNQWIILLFVALIGFLMTLSSYVNNVESFYLRASMYNGVLFFLIFAYSIILARKGEIKTLVLAGKWYLLVLIIINDLLMFVLPNKFYNISGSDIGTCLIGNKFSVAYAHLMLFFLLVLLENREKLRTKKIAVYTFIMTVLCIFIDCMTVMLGAWIFAIMYFLIPSLKKIFSNFIIFTGCFFCSAFLLILFENILSLDIVKNFIIGVLHRDPTLTGRMQIYPYIFQAFPSHKWLGYGYGISIIETMSTWYSNAQNAFWDFVLRYGLIAVIVLLLLLVIVVIKNESVQKKVGYRPNLWASLSMIYVYLFMGIGEIVYNKQFFFYIAILNSFILYYSMKKNKEIGEKNYDRK